MLDKENIFSDELWTTTGEGKMLIYDGPYLKNSLDVNEVKNYTKKRKAKAARWTYDYDCNEQTCWYHIIYDDKPLEVDDIPRSNIRYKVRRSFKHCNVKEIPCEYLLENGYEVYLKASTRYRNFTPKSEKKFKEEIRIACEKKNGQPIGVFVDEKLIAYAMVFLKYKSLKVATSFFDPDYSNLYPMYGLHFYFQTYLKKDNCNEITNGAFPLLHETNIDRFLLRFGWRKAYARLGLYLPKQIEVILLVARFTRPLWKTIIPGKHANILNSLLKAQKIAKATKINDNGS